MKRYKNIQTESREMEYPMKNLHLFIGIPFISHSISRDSVCARNSYPKYQKAVSNQRRCVLEEKNKIKNEDELRKKEIKKLDEDLVELHEELDALKKEKSRIFAALKGTFLKMTQNAFSSCIFFLYIFLRNFLKKFARKKHSEGKGNSWCVNKLWIYLKVFFIIRDRKNFFEIPEYFYDPLLISTIKYSR